MRDTAFAANRQEPLHRWVPWIAGFSATFVQDILRRLPGTPQGRLVLDPFAGVGTTLVEAMLHGCDAVGFEINPYAVLACKAKLSVGTHDADELRGATGELRRFMSKCAASPGVPRSQPPAGFTSRAPFFSPAVQRQVLLALDFIHQLRSDWLQDMLRVALGAVMVEVSNYSYEPSLGRRVAAGKPEVADADLAAILSAKLDEMAADMCWARERLNYLPQVCLHGESFLHGWQRLEPSSVDCVITSPPYLNNYHYVRNTRPQLFWLGLVESRSDLKRLEQESFGKFWQTVRSGPQVRLEVDYPELEDLIARLAAVDPERGAYGGPGWASYAASYFNDCGALCAALRRLLRLGGLAVIVIGNSILQGIEVPTDRLLAGIAARTGLQVEGIEIVRTKRVGSSIINSPVRAGPAPGRVELYEAVVTLLG